jgi:hypothetical protein
MDSDAIYDVGEDAGAVPLTAANTMQVIVRAGRSVVVIGNTEPYEDAFRRLGGAFEEIPQTSWVFPHQHREQIEGFLTGAEGPFETIISPPEDETSGMNNADEREPFMGGPEAVFRDVQQVDMDPVHHAATPNATITLSVEHDPEIIASPMMDATIMPMESIAPSMGASSASTLPETAPIGILDAPPLLGAENQDQHLPSPSEVAAELGSPLPEQPSTTIEPPLTATSASLPLAIDTAAVGPLDGGTQQQDRPVVLPFSPRLFALVGNTELWTDKMKGVGGKFKKHLKIGDSKMDGWTFPKKKLDQVQSSIPCLVLTPSVIAHEQGAAALQSPTKKQRTGAGTGSTSSAGVSAEMSGSASGGETSGGGSMAVSNAPRAAAVA